MPRTCIICGAATSSREHVFPATLGGRRTNRGIYCAQHNEALGALANVIGPQLRFFNALLAVRPDHQDKASPLRHTAENGDQFVIFDGVVAREGLDSNSAHAGIDLQLSYGGPDGLRSIAYIALTFFAHHFPHEAREPGIQPLKNFVVGESENEFAWWLHGDIAEQLPPSPFEFGHTVVITIDSHAEEATAVISLFGDLHFGVLLGSLQSSEDSSVVVFVDPRCDHPPDDVQVTRGRDARLAQRRPDPLQAHLMRMFEEGAANSGFQKLMSRIEGWRFRRDMTPVQHALNGLRGQPEFTRRRAIDEIVGAQPQRIFRLMRYVAQRYEAGADDTDLFEFTKETLRRMTEPDSGSETGLTEFAHAAAMLSGSAIAAEICRKLDSEEVDIQYLRQLFSGGRGAAIVGEAMLRPLIAALGRLAG